MNSGYMNVGSSGTNRKHNMTEDARRRGQATEIYRRPHYTSYQDARNTGYARKRIFTERDRSYNRNYGSGRQRKQRRRRPEKDFLEKAAAAIVTGVLLG